MKLFALTFILSCIVLNIEAQNDEIKDKQALSFKPQFYLYANHDNSSGNNFLSDGHDPDFLGAGLQINFIKYQDFKLGISWEYRKYDVVDISKIGNLDHTLYFSGIVKLQYQYDFLKKWALEPTLGIGSTRIVQRYEPDETNDATYGLNLNAGLNLSFKITNHLAIFTGYNYSRISFGFDTPEKWDDYFNKVSLTQINFGIIVSVESY